MNYYNTLKLIFRAAVSNPRNIAKELAFAALSDNDELTDCFFGGKYCVKKELSEVILKSSGDDTLIADEYHIAFSYGHDSAVLEMKSGSRNAVLTTYDRNIKLRLTLGEELSKLISNWAGKNWQMFIL